MKIGKKKFKQPLFALEEQEKAMGMQVLNEIDEEICMIFPYLTSQELIFHMANVKFPLDIIFCNKGKINKIYHNIQPNDMTKFKSFGDCVVETMGGLCEKYGIKEGMSIYI
jgi:uncharacterized membrane protein (UPF0127 family)